MRLNTRAWGEGSRVAVLIHGMMADSQGWWQVAPAIAEHGYRVIAVDMPGHGLSPRAADATVDLFVEALLESIPRGPALALGHSMGGSILGLAVERLQPERAVYVDVPFEDIGRHPDGERPDLAVTIAAKYRAQKEGRTLEYLRRNRAWWSEQDMAVEISAVENWDVATAASVSASAATERRAGRDFTPSTAIPSLMIRPEPSDCVSPDYAERLAARGFAVRSIPGAGHSAWFGYFDEFMAALDGWV